MGLYVAPQEFKKLPQYLKCIRRISCRHMSNLVLCIFATDKSIKC